MKLFAIALSVALSTAANAVPLEANADLASIAAADEQDRSGPFSSFDGAKVAPRDAERRKHVKEILARGDVRSGRDYFNAALIFQHGDTPDDYRLAFALMTIASTMAPERIGPKAAAASAWDRLLISVGKPQWYGTQFVPSKTAAGALELAPIDETVVTDEERKARGVPTLAESRAHAQQFK